jgi:polar amino acid transport system substrate-binding protein
MRRLLPAILLLLTTVWAGAAQAETFRFTASPRCPHACPDLPDQGELVQMLRATFNAAGADIEIEFLPWQRAVTTARHDAAFAGYLAEDGSVAQGFVLSPPLTVGTLGLAVRRGSEQGDVSPAALRGLSLAVLAGHAITSGIDGAIATRRLAAYAVDDEATMLRMLAAGRLDAAVIDADAFAWQLRNAVDLAPARELLTFNPVPLARKTQHAAFAANPLGRRAQMTFAAGRALKGLWPVQVSQLPGGDIAERVR